MQQIADNSGGSGGDSSPVTNQYMFVYTHTNDLVLSAGTYTVMPFHHVIADYSEGNYNTNGSIFTPPVDGVYGFALLANVGSVNSGDAVNYFLTLNGGSPSTQDLITVDLGRGSVGGDTIYSSAYVEIWLPAGRTVVPWTWATGGDTLLGGNTITKPRGRLYAGKLVREGPQ
jgi:hypothetical protein